METILQTELSQPFPAPGLQPVRIRQYTEADAVRWDEFVRTHTAGEFFHLSGWMRVMQRTFAYRCSALLAEEDDRVTGVLPLFLVSNWILGRALISVPFGVYAGIAAEDDQSYAALLQHAKSMTTQAKVDYLELRKAAGAIDPEFHRNSRYATFRCVLDADPEQNLKRLPRDTRYMIRKGMKAGMQVQHGSQYLSDFYNIFALNMRRHGTPLFPKSYFENLLQEFRDESDLMVLYHSGRAVAGVLSFLFKGAVLPYYSGASEDATKLAANNLLYWELMKWACERGLRSFDFGRSKRGTGAFDFKRTWNMEEVALPYEVFLGQRTSPPDFSPANPLFEKATRLWSRLPLWTTRCFGPRVVRWFP